MSVSRREFLTKSARVAGAAYPAMLALGMLKSAPAHAFDLPGNGNGKKVVIIGAGLAGMAAAYELIKLGYSCTILEARNRAGGGCWSVRKGTTHIETDPALANCHF